jgi:hypothetical protein
MAGVKKTRNGLLVFADKTGSFFHPIDAARQHEIGK